VPETRVSQETSEGEKETTKAEDVTVKAFKHKFAMGLWRPFPVSVDVLLGLLLGASARKETKWENIWLTATI
jgi:hypothetical protein